MKKIIMATNNKGKIAELKKMLKGYDVLSQEEADIDDLYVEEDGETFVDNAVIKANSIKDLVYSDEMVLAEDSGICIEALGGYPGTKTKRAAYEELGDYVTEEDRLNLILDKMENEKNRKVVWQTAIALIDKKGLHTFVGEVEGVVADDMIGDNGFGFDPIFLIPEENMTLAQMSFEMKSKYSARKRAIDKMIKYLSKN